MAHAIIGMIVFIDLMSGATMWPLPSASSSPMSMYEMCTTTDLHQIEELKETLFEELNKSSISVDKYVPSISFGLLDEDWERLLLLEKRLPEESVLKFKLLVVFRILIAALYQAHGSAFEQDNNIISDEDFNSLDDKVVSPLSELEFGESKNDNVYDSYSDRKTTFGNLVSNGVFSSSGSFEETQRLNHTNLIDSSKPSDIPPTTLALDEYDSRLKSSYSEKQNITSVNSIAARSREYLDKNCEDSIVSVSEYPILDSTELQDSDITTTENLVTLKTEPNKYNDAFMEFSLTNLPRPVKVYVEEVFNVTTTVRSHFQQSPNEITSGYASTVDNPTSTIHTEIINTTSNNVGLNYMTKTSHFNSREIIDTTKSFEDPTASTTGLYPELVQIILGTERNHFKTYSENMSRDSLEDVLSVSATTSGSLGKKRVSEDMAASESVIHKVLLPSRVSEQDTQEITGNDLVGGNTEAVGDRANNLTYYPNEYNSQSNWYQNKSNPPNTSKNGYDIHKLTLIDPDDFSKTLEDTVVTAFPGPAIYIKNAFENRSSLKNLILNDHTSKNSTDDILSNTADVTLSDPNLRVSNVANNVAQEKTTQVFDANLLTPIENLLAAKDDPTIFNTGKESFKTTNAVMPFSNPVDIRPIGFKSPPKVEEKLEKYLTSEKEDDTQSRSVERNDFSPTNGDEALASKSATPISSVENDNLRSSVEEKGIFNSRNDENTNLSETGFPENSEIVSSVGNDILQNSVKEKDIFSLRNFDSTYPSETVVPESLERISSVETQNVQSTIEEEESFGSSHGYNMNYSKTVAPKNSERMSSVEDVNLQSSQKEETILNSPNGYDTDSAETVVPESLERMSSVEDVNLRSSQKEETILNSPNGYDTDSAETVVPESSEPISKIEQVNIQSSLEEKEVYSSTNCYGTHHDTTAVPENSEYMSNAKNFNLTSIIKEHVVFTSTNYDEVNPVQPCVLPENFDSNSSVGNDNLKSSVKEIGNYGSRNDDTSFYKVVDPEISGHIYSVENDYSQSVVEEKEVFSSKNDYGKDLNGKVDPESPEILLSAEKGSQNRNEEKEVLILKSYSETNPTETVFAPESSERISSLEDINLQSSIKGNEMFSSRNVLSSNPAETVVSERSESNSSVENDNLQSSVEAIDVYGSRDDDITNPSETIVRESSESISKVENVNVQSSVKGKEVFSSTKEYGTYPEETGIRENLEYIPSIKNVNLLSSVEGKKVFSSRNGYNTDLDKSVSPESSESVSGVRNDSLQSSVKEIDIFGSRNNSYIYSSESVVPKSSEHINSVEKVNLQSSIEEKQMFSSTSEYDTETIETIVPTEHVYSAENVNLQSRVEEKEELTYRNDYGPSPAETGHPENFEQVIGSKNNNIESIYKLNVMSRDWTDDQITPRPNLNHSHGSNDTADSESEENIDTSVLDQYVPQPSPKADETLTVTEQGKELFRAFNSFHSKSVNYPLPTRSYNELKIYPAHLYTYKFSNSHSRKDCSNGNSCVHVKHIEYKSNENPFSTSLAKRVNYKLKSESRESSESKEYMSSRFMSQPEGLIWKEKIRHLKLSAYD